MLLQRLRETAHEQCRLDKRGSRCTQTTLVIITATQIAHCAGIEQLEWFTEGLQVTCVDAVVFFASRTGGGVDFATASKRPGGKSVVAHGSGGKVDRRSIHADVTPVSGIVASIAAAAECVR